ncbi:MAG TPA: hypothetical protein VIG24_11470 [Acidimicrobiia bacterium]
MENIDYQAALTLAFIIGIVALSLLILTGWLELRAKRQDELEDFRRTIEAMRRMEQQDGDR